MLFYQASSPFTSKSYIDSTVSSPRKSFQNSLNFNCVLGPIIRVTPHELHVADPNYFDELYNCTTQPDKYEWMCNRFGNPSCILETCAHELHRTRRAALNPLFSRREIHDKFVPMIWQKINQLCSKLEQIQIEGRVTPINRAWSAFAGDIMSQLAFGESYNHLASPDFEVNFHDGFVAAAKLGPVCLQFPWIGPFMRSVPSSLVLKMQPLFGILFKAQDVRPERTIHLAKKIYSLLMRPVTGYKQCYQGYC